MDKGEFRRYNFRAPNTGPRNWVLSSWRKRLPAGFFMLWLVNFIYAVLQFMLFDIMSLRMFFEKENPILATLSQF